MAVGSAALVLGEQATGLPLFTPAMMSSGIIFFYGARPPPPGAFLWGTGLCSTLGLGIVTACAQLEWPSNAGHCIAATALLAAYRGAGAAFPPVAALPGVLVGVAAGPDAASLSAAMHFLLFPWLAGHGVLYSVAMAAGVARRGVRDKLNAAAFSRYGGLSDEKLRKVFDSFDMTGNGSLGVLELQVALRRIGHTTTTEEAARLLRSVDADGSGEIDFNEFKHICRDAL